jgi:membrane protease YdiL (CAAX protease family)
VAGDRLTGSDKRALLLWVLAGIIGALVGYKYYFQAFPEAAVNLQVSREEAVQRAQQFVAGMGENISDYQSAIVFTVDEEAKTYLEREVGLQQTNQLLSSQLHIWYWEARFFKPLREEEFFVRVSPTGQIVGYDHILAESSAGVSLDREAALAGATQFASGKLGINFADWGLLTDEVSSTQRPNRLDWSFTWEKRGFRAKDAPYRLEVGLQGDRIGDSKELLKVPEAWKRDYAQLRARNNFLTSVAIVPYILILGAALWLSIALTRRGTARWAGALIIGLLAAVLLFCMSINEWPQMRMEYDTNSSYATFILKEVVKALLFGLGSAITITLVLPAAEALYRVSQPARVQLGKAFSWRGLRSKEFFCSSVVGLCLTSASLGFVVVFYVVGSRYFGVWAPQDISYTNSVSTLFPWISGVAIGLLASTNEEFTFRLFAIPFFERLTGSRWLAVIIPAFCWSFLHTNYPQEPPYIRGLEVGSLGIITGIVFLRWGILATLIWHYTFDASQVGLLLIRSHNWYFKISGIVVGAAAVAPLLFAAISYLQRGGFDTDEDLLNAAEPAPDVSLRSPATEIAASGEAARRYDALTPAMLALLALLTVCGAVSVWRLKPPAIGDYLKLSTDARTAKMKADVILRQRGVDPDSYRHAVVFVDNTDPQINEYLRERIGVTRLNEIYATQVPGALWRVRYFRDSQKEEYAVILKPDGALHSVWHVLAEDTPGAQLDKDAAVALSEKFLRDEKQVDLQQWKLVVADSKKRPHRVDYTLEWQQNQPLNPAASGMANPAQEAYARMRLQVIGDEVTRYQTFIKIPEEWSRQQEALNVPRLALAYGVPFLLYGALALSMLIIYLRNLKSEAAQEVPWRRVALWSLWALLAFFTVFAMGNRIAEFFNNYQTDQPLKLNVGGLVIALLIGGPFYFACVTLLFGVAWYYARRAFDADRLPSWLGMPALYYRDALFIGIGGTAALVALRRLIQTAFLYWPTTHREVAAAFGTDFDATVPAGSILATALLRGLLMTALVTAMASFVAACIPQKWLRTLLFIGGALAMVGGSWGNAADYVKQSLAELVLLAVLVLGVRYVMKFNLLGCFLVVFASTALGALTGLLRQDVSFYRANAFAGLAALLALFAWPLLAWLFSSRSVPPSSAASVA